jgi:hypothetical protein
MVARGALNDVQNGVGEFFVLARKEVETDRSIQMDNRETRRAGHRDFLSMDNIQTAPSNAEPGKIVRKKLIDRSGSSPHQPHNRVAEVIQRFRKDTGRQNRLTAAFCNRGQSARSKSASSTNMPNLSISPIRNSLHT